MADPKKSETQPAKPGVVTTQAGEKEPPAQTREAARRVMDKELKAMSVICAEFAALDEPSQRRVLTYLTERFAPKATATN